MSHWCCTNVCAALQTLRPTLRHAALPAATVAERDFDEDVLDEAGRSFNWSSVLEGGPTNLATLRKDQPILFKELAVTGVPSDLRWEIWKAALGGLHSIGGQTGQYQKLISMENSTWKTLIEQDSKRTFVPLDKVETLQKILSAYANLSPEVGYCQGMNFVVGLLLFVSGGHEEETFWVFVALMRNMHLSGFYAGGFPLLKQYMDGFGQLVATVLPRLCSRLQAEGIQFEEFLQSWYLTLFVTCLPKAAVVEIWDEIICCSGLPLVVPLAVALLECVPISDSSQMRRQLKSLLKDVVASKASAIAQFLRRRADGSLGPTAESSLQGCTWHVVASTVYLLCVGIIRI